MISVGYKKTFVSGIKKGMTVDCRVRFEDETSAEKWQQDILAKQETKGNLKEYGSRDKFTVSDFSFLILKSNFRL